MVGIASKLISIADACPGNFELGGRAAAPSFLSACAIARGLGLGRPVPEGLADDTVGTSALDLRRVSGWAPIAARDGPAAVDDHGIPRPTAAADPDRYGSATDLDLLWRTSARPGLDWVEAEVIWVGLVI
jgi:hypothetical protein